MATLLISEMRRSRSPTTARQASLRTGANGLIVGVVGAVVILGVSLGATVAAPDRPLAGQTNHVRIRTAPPLALKPVDFNHPMRSYVHRRVLGWPLWIEKQLVEEDPELAGQAVRRLRRMLRQALRVMPPAAAEVFSRLKFFLMYGERSKHGGRNNGLEYFQQTAPKHHQHLDPRMGSSILIYSAANWVWLPEHRARMALVHELAHAYHLEQWPELRPDIYEAWQQAVHNGLYRRVRDEAHRVLPQGYARQNHLEYFAELSMIYFVGGYYEPFTRERLATYDPAGYALIEKLWRVRDGKPVPSVTSDGPRHETPARADRSTGKRSNDASRLGGLRRPRQPVLSDSKPAALRGD